MTPPMEYSSPYLIRVQWFDTDRVCDYTYWSVRLWAEHYDGFCKQASCRRVETYVWLDKEKEYRLEHVWSND